jgi:hypothetical protein
MEISLDSNKPGRRYAAKKNNPPPMRITSNIKMMGNVMLRLTGIAVTLVR